MRSKERRRWLEHLALMFASFVWTAVVLAVVVVVWVYQDFQAGWDDALNGPSEVLAQAAFADDLFPLQAAEPLAAPAVTATTGPTSISTATISPTPAPQATNTPPPTLVPPPVILPETVGIGEPTPIPVIVHQAEDVAQLGQPESTSATIISSVEPAFVSPQGSSTALDLMPTVATPAPATQQSSLRPAPTATASPTLVVVEPAIPTRLEIPAIGVASDIIPVGWRLVEQNGQRFSIWEVADYAVGWHQTSAALGEPGNTVMAGHNNINGEVFRDLANVEVGDKIVAYAGEQKFEYTVELKTIVKEKGEPLEVRQRNAQWIQPTGDERLTLVSCWPYTSNTHRVVVVAKPGQS